MNIGNEISIKLMVKGGRFVKDDEGLCRKVVSGCAGGEEESKTTFLFLFSFFLVSPKSGGTCQVSVG